MKYSGSCQCGKVTFDADMQIDKVLSCNCSRCRRTGTLLAFTDKDRFTLKSGKDALKEYQFNKNVIHHFFCATCGIQPFSFSQRRDGTSMVAINVNCLDGVDPRALPARQFDGRAA